MSDPFDLGTVTTELQETKQRLEKAREERFVMVTCLSSLEEELERTRKELENLKFEQKSKEQVMVFLQMHPSLKNKKKKKKKIPLIPLIGGIFSRKKRSNSDI